MAPDPAPPLTDGSTAAEGVGSAGRPRRRAASGSASDEPTIDEPTIDEPTDEEATAAPPIDPPADPDDEPVAAASRRRPTGSRRRTKQAALVVGLALASAAGGVVVGSRLKSPADAASERAAPVASTITVPVELRRLVSTLVVTGEIRYIEPTSVRLAGAVGTSGGDTQVVTRIPELDSELVEGGVLVEISGRPVFALQGELPMYRQLTPGANGPDVVQLETALQRLGFDPGPIDEIYDEATEAALDAFYESRGFSSEGPSDTQRTELNAARKAVADAEEGVRRANLELANGAGTVSQSERLAAQQDVDRAQAAVPAAQASADRENQQAASATQTAAALRDNARAQRDTQQALVAAASAPGAINPDTGEAYTPVEIATLQQELNALEQALIQAEQAVTIAAADQQATANRGAGEVADAQAQLDLARARLNDLLKPQDTTALREAVTAAQETLALATTTLAELEAETGTIVPAGEVVFLPTLPTNVTALNAQLGAPPPTDQLAQVSSTDTEIVGRVSKADAELISTGTTVTLELRDVGIETTGTVVDIRSPSANPDPNNPDGGRSGSGASDDRLEIVVNAEDSARIRDFIWSSVRISVAVSSTDDEVLAVPVAAISVAPDGTSRVEVERVRARGTREGVTEVVEVSVGLAAQGYAEITPLRGASIEPGDRVVVGVETGARQSRRERASDRADDGEASG
jgi:peptidoglycan hydrolase-like protein with peptidoglycan-binding domain